MQNLFPSHCLFYKPRASGDEAKANLNIPQKKDQKNNLEYISQATNLLEPTYTGQSP